MSRRCVRATISGTVQGVGFRWFVQTQLGDLGLSGTVENLPDGRVEAVVEGSPERVEQALVILGTGPLGAHVADVEIEELTARCHTGFEIR